MYVFFCCKYFREFLKVQKQILYVYLKILRKVSSLSNVSIAKILNKLNKKSFNKHRILSSEDQPNFGFSPLTKKPLFLVSPLFVSKWPKSKLSKITHLLPKSICSQFENHNFKNSMPYAFKPV